MLGEATQEDGETGADGYTDRRGWIHRGHGQVRMDTQRTSVDGYTDTDGCKIRQIVKSARKVGS
jgi:hypothetical protein